MGAHNAFRTRPERKSGVLVGSADHRILLALRGPGGMTTDQLYERFESDYPSHALYRLERAGLITRPGTGKKGEAVSLTEAGRAAVCENGPLARRASLITYCQL